MPPKTDQPKTLRQEIDEVFDKHFKAGATKDELKEVADTLIAKINELQAFYGEKMAENKAEMGAQSSQLAEEMAAMEARVREVIAGVDSKSQTSVDKAIQQLREEVKSVEDRIPEETDLTELYERLTEHEGKMDDLSMLQKAENIRNALELLEGDERLSAEAIRGLDELIKQVVSLSGAVTKLQGASQTPSPVHWPRHESFVMNGSDTTVTLAAGVGAAGNAIFGIRYNGQTLDKDDQYTVSGNKITFTFTPVNGSTISVSYYG